MVGIPLSFRYEGFSMMLRVFHQSSHLGDEFLLRTRTERINLSYQSVDLKLSYEFGNLLRLYAGGGYLFGQDPSSLKPLSVQLRRGAHEPLAVPPIALAADRGCRRPAAPGKRLEPRRLGPRRHRDRRRAAHPQAPVPARNTSTAISPNGQFYKDRVQYF